MIEIAIVQPVKINPDRLHEEMQTALGTKYVSMDTGKRFSRQDTENKIVVRLTDDATNEDKDKAATVVEDHKPDVLSKHQQRAKDRADAFQRLTKVDIASVRAKTGKAQIESILDLLEDIQRLLQGTDNG